MKFAKVETSFRDHPKAMMAGAAGIGVWLCALTYCRDHLTDGFIPEPAMMGFLGGKENARAVKNLLSAGLISKTDGGYILNNYAAKNDTKADVEAAIEATRKRVQSHRKKRVCNALQDDDVTRINQDLCNANVPPSPSLLSSLSESGESVRGGPTLVPGIVLGNALNRDGLEPTPENPDPLTAEDRYALAYAQGQTDASKAPYPPPVAPWERGAINRFTLTDGWGLGLRGQELLDAIRAWSRDYRRARDEKSQFEKGFAPTKCEEWARGANWKYVPARAKPPPKPKRDEPVQLVDPTFALRSITAAIGGGMRR